MYTDILVHNVTSSLLEIADVFGAKSFDVYIDENEYPAGSVLNNEFAKLQGQSLVFSFDRVLKEE